MKKLLAMSALVLLAAPASAAGTSLRSLISGSGGQLTTSRGVFLVSKRTTDLTYLTLGIGYSETTGPGRADGVTVYAQREYLKPSELALFNKTIRQVALKCFNLSEARLPAIDAWLTRQNTSPLRDVVIQFGPMTANYRRMITDDGTYHTYVTMFRQGTPGVGPWGNYCTP